MANKTFYSDNCSGTNATFIKTLRKVNFGYTPSYGDDEYTHEAKGCFRNIFGKQVDSYFVLSGTLANVFILHHLLKDGESLLCSDVAHIKTAEEASHKFYTHFRYLLVPTKDGKMTLESIKSVYDKNKKQKIKVLSITNPTEYGTVYTKEEIKNLSSWAHKNNILVHMDGARIANAAASLGLSLKEITFDCGVDALYFGGTKNGLIFGEAIIFKNKDISGTFHDTYEKLAGSFSKMRFLSVQYTNYLRNNIWEKNAIHANKMAKYFAGHIKNLKHIKISRPVQTNAVFVKFNGKHKADLAKKQFDCMCYDDKQNEFRFMFSFDTTRKDIDTLVQFIL